MKCLVLCLTFITGLFLSGCSHTSELTRKYIPNNGTGINFSVIYYIHADADYLYHTSEGQPVRDNRDVLTTAFEVGANSRSGEVFIYYQRPIKKILGLIPQKSSQLFHFKKGQLITYVKYRHPDKKEAFLTTEAQLIDQYRSQNRDDSHRNYFLYFGHEIPAESGKNYHRSLPDVDVNAVSFATGIQNFLLSDEDSFDLAVLSTCNNGTPAMVKHLMPFTHAMLASPQNLHLSHVDSGSMALLEKEPGISPLQLGRLMAEGTYHRLEETVHTTITLALYNFEEIGEYIQPLTLLTSSKEASDQSIHFQDNVDCTQFPLLDSESFSKGVETWYKPARFGRPSGQYSHSGWGCKPSIGN